MIAKYESFLSRFFTKLNPIQKLCKKYKIENYTINSDGSIDVNGNVRINGCNLNEIPLKFKKVSGKFDCSNNNLISLEGCPQEVGEHFNCERNNLTSLEGGPTIVGGSYICSDNSLTSLKYSPEKIRINFICINNKLTSLDGGPTKVDGDYFCSRNKLTSLYGSPYKIGYDFDCSYNELISLEGRPISIGTEFNFRHNHITSIDFFNYKIKVKFKNNPVYDLIRLFTTKRIFLSSLDYGYLRGNKIIKKRFEEALSEVGKNVPNNIGGYQYI